MESFQELQHRIEIRRSRKAQNRIKGIKIFLENMRTLRRDKQRAIAKRRFEIKLLAAVQHNDKLEAREMSRQISQHEKELKELQGGHDGEAKA